MSDSCVHVVYGTEVIIGNLEDVDVDQVIEDVNSDELSRFILLPAIAGTDFCYVLGFRDMHYESDGPVLGIDPDRLRPADGQMLHSRALGAFADKWGIECVGEAGWFVVATDR